jgi:hypothetical protein
MNRRLLEKNRSAVGSPDPVPIKLMDGMRGALPFGMEKRAKSTLHGVKVGILKRKRFSPLTHTMLFPSVSLLSLNSNEDFFR